VNWWRLKLINLFSLHDSIIWITQKTFYYLARTLGWLLAFGLALRFALALA